MDHGRENNIKKTSTDFKNVWPLELEIQTSDECSLNIKKQSWQCFTQKHTVPSLRVQYYIISWRFYENEIMYIWFSGGLYTFMGNGVLYALTYSQMKGRPCSIVVFKEICSIWIIFFLNSQQRLAQSISQKPQSNKQGKSS